MSSKLPNDPRYAGTPGHVESWFLRANDPARPRAFWLKATILAPAGGARGSGAGGVPDGPVAEVWCIVFDGERDRVWAHRTTVAYPAASFQVGDRLTIEIGHCRFQLGTGGHVSGTMARPGAGAARWDLGYRAAAGPIAAPLNILPFESWVDGPFPRSKPLTPNPSLLFSGVLECFGDTWTVHEWPGMQGHNWGREHAWEYAWGQCLFPATGGRAEAMVEGFTARIRLGPWTTPRMSGLVVRSGERELRFDTLLDVWRQRAEIDDLRWTVDLRSADGEVSLTMDATGRPMACLGYGNPDGRASYCFNSKLARVTLDLRPALGAAVRHVSEHGGALEFLRGTPDPRFPDII